MDISFYNRLYFGLYLQTPTITTGINSQVIVIIIPRLTFVVPPRIELGTHGFSVHCSTNWAKVPICTPGRIRTLILLIRSQTLYPVKPPVRVKRIATVNANHSPESLLLDRCVFVPAEGLEPPNPKGSWFTVSCNCRYAIQAFAGYRLTCGAASITHLRCHHQRFFCSSSGNRTHLVNYMQ